MPELDLLRSYPRQRRNVAGREVSRDAETIAVSKRYGFDYFDGDRKYGYGGYRYDGRWVPVARDVILSYRLMPGSRVLDVGCAKGYLVHDLTVVAPRVEAFGLDVSEYAVMNCHPGVVGRVHLGSATQLPFPDKSFDLVLAINVIHNLPRAAAERALLEIQRVARRGSYVQVDSWRTDEEHRNFERWVLTAESYGPPEYWRAMFERVGYSGDYGFTVIE